MTKQTKKGLFRYFSMDCARMIYLALIPCFRLRCLGTDGRKKPSKVKGGAIIAANHTGFIDPFVLSTLFWRRRLFLLTAKEVMATKVREFWLTRAGCIKIDRSISDMVAIRQCVTVLKAGKLLGMFPEGHIQRDGDMDSVKSGAVLISLQADVPVIPFYSQKPSRWWHRRRVIMGEPIHMKEICGKRFPSVADIEQLSTLLQTKMEECKSTYEQTNF
ncbi:MAG: 1-acyl-sn-glycerol-3-phosphate acyltransferase [Clostridia bacterium]|nr:1-acyl-sn-glycerol-3-phosphate acyltransferase [Clostridia bacterium]